jgi:hypothetical protein
MKKGTYLISSLVKLHTKKFENPQNDKKIIKDFETFKVHEKKSKYPSLPLQNFTQRFLKTHKMTRKKIESFKTSK